jgi:CubicO group peptidase (beta-lactamase class C family)
MPASKLTDRMERFETQVEVLRGLLKIPGLTAVIVRDQAVLWARGFGYTDVENHLAAAPASLFHIASLTKTFASTALLQWVERDQLDLDEPISHYSSDFKDDLVKIRHLLSHTSEGPTPGEHYQYSGNRYDYLTAVIEKKAGKSFRQVIVETFLDPLEMAGSVPGHDVVDDVEKWASLLGQENLDRYALNLQSLAQPYTLYGESEIVLVPYPPRDINTAAGLLSTVLDLAKYDAAIDRHVLIEKATQERSWTAFESNSGQILPHGLGWFILNHQSVKLIWHYGHWGTGFSAIYLKVPEKDLSLIMLANSEALSDHQFQVGEDITNNVFASEFLRLFVFEESLSLSLPDPHWTLNRQDFVSELERLSGSTDGYSYDGERNSQLALSKWREDRRSRAVDPIEVEPGLLDEYAGQYKFEPPEDFTLTVIQEGARLYVDIPLNQKSEMFAETKEKFFLKIRPYQITFVREAGQITRMELAAYGKTYQGKKVN